MSEMAAVAAVADTACRIPTKIPQTRFNARNKRQQKRRKMLQLLQMLLLRDGVFCHIYNHWWMLKCLPLTPCPFPRSNRARGAIQSLGK